MAKLFSKMKIIRMKDGREEVILPRTVFEATPAEAKQFDKLKSARPATEAEIKGSGATPVDEAPAAPAATPVAMPDSGAAGDPKSNPKGKAV